MKPNRRDQFFAAIEFQPGIALAQTVSPRLLFLKVDAFQEARDLYGILDDDFRVWCWWQRPAPNEHTIDVAELGKESLAPREMEHALWGGLAKGGDMLLVLGNRGGKQAKVPEVRKLGPVGEVFDLRPRGRKKTELGAGLDRSKIGDFTVVDLEDPQEGKTAREVDIFQTLDATDLEKAQGREFGERGSVLHAAGIEIEIPELDHPCQEGQVQIGNRPEPQIKEICKDGEEGQFATIRTGEFQVSE